MIWINFLRFPVGLLWVSTGYCWSAGAARHGCDALSSPQSAARVARGEPSDTDADGSEDVLSDILARSEMRTRSSSTSWVQPRAHVLPRPPFGSQRVASRPRHSSAATAGRGFQIVAKPLGDESVRTVELLVRECDLRLLYREIRPRSSSARSAWLTDACDFFSDASRSRVSIIASTWPAATISP